MVNLRLFLLILDFCEIVKFLHLHIKIAFNNNLDIFSLIKCIFYNILQLKYFSFRYKYFFVFLNVLFILHQKV
jgi:hypothetical protein